MKKYYNNLSRKQQGTEFKALVVGMEKIRKTWKKMNGDRMGGKGRSQRCQKRLQKQMIRRTGNDSHIKENNKKCRGLR